jgi:hypothetical protein
MNHAHGVLTTISGAIGECQDMTADNDAKEITVLSSLGITKNVEHIDHFNTVTGRFKFDRGAALPIKGDVVTVAASNSIFNGRYYVDKSEFHEVNADAPEATITAKRYVDGGLPGSS